MTLDANKALTRRLYDEMNKNNVDALNELLHPDYSEFTTLFPEPLTRDSAAAVTRMLHGVIPGLQRRLIEQVAEGDKVVDRVEYTGTLAQDFRGIPAGTNLAFTSVLFHRIEDGAIRETWSISDRLAMFERAGIAPPLPETQ